MSTLTVERGRHWGANAARAVGVAAFVNIILRTISYHGEMDKLIGPIVGSLMWVPLAWLIGFASGYIFETVSQTVIGAEYQPWEHARRNAQYKRHTLSLPAFSAMTLAGCLLVALIWGGYLASRGRLLVAVDGNPVVGSLPSPATIASSTIVQTPVPPAEKPQSRERWYIMSNGQIMDGGASPSEEACEVARRALVWNAEESAQKAVRSLAGQPQVIAYPLAREIGERVSRVRAAYCSRL